MMKLIWFMLNVMSYMKKPPQLRPRPSQWIGSDKDSAIQPKRDNKNFQKTPIILLSIVILI